MGVYTHHKQLYFEVLMYVVSWPTVVDHSVCIYGMVVLDRSEEGMGKWLLRGGIYGIE